MDFADSNIFNTTSYRRKLTLEVNVGNTPLGGSNPIRLQTMTTTNTNSIAESVEQCIKAIDAGAEYVRLTTQGVREAQSLGQIKQELIKRGYKTPLVADIHFNPAAAMEATNYADKIRINPGNFSDKSRTSTQNFSEAEYNQELSRAEARFLELLSVCKQNNVAIRIGVNHGSLSQRIMSRYGDTPMGMALSAIEFVRICNKHNHHQVVVSMKSSNTRVMVQATRLLVKMMNDEGLNYPIHLGVTEAGEGEDGRIKSAVGIGALLVDGIGDTVRVSLTEPTENEIPVAKHLVDIFSGWQNPKIFEAETIPVNPFEYKRRATKSIEKIGGNNPPVVMAHIVDVNTEVLAEWGWSYSVATNTWTATENAADYIYIGDSRINTIPNPNSLPLVGTDNLCRFNLIGISDLLKRSSSIPNHPFFVKVDVDTINVAEISALADFPNAICILNAKSPYHFYSIRNILFYLYSKGIETPCVVAINFSDVTTGNFQIQSAAIAGPLFLDGLADGIMISTPKVILAKTIRATAFGILQAARVRISKTEFISCPGCGRTLFSLNQTLLKVKERTAHLKGLKIGVMGCIVNGPGEMADADYGYVGSGPGRVTLYKKQEIVKKNIPESEAVDELIELIKANGDWVSNSSG